MADYTFYVKVANSKFVLDSVSQATIALGHDITYRFDQSDSSNSGHPLVFSTTSDGTHNSGSAYTTGVTTTGTAGSSGAYVDIAVTSSTPASLYYYCSNHSGMGSAVITTGNTHVTTNNLGLLLPILADATDQWGSHINQSLRKIEDTFGANADVYTYNITGDTTAITGSATAGGTLAFNDGQHIEVYLNGVKLVGNLSSGNDYTLNASTNTITLASNAVNGDVVNVVVFKTFQFADAVPATGGTFSGDVTVPNLIIGDGGNIGSASDTDAIKIDSSGDIGVGYSSPSSRLHVNGVLNGDILKLTGVGTESRGLTVSNFSVSGVNGVGVDFDAVGSGGVQGTLSFSTNSTERLRIESSGSITTPNGEFNGTIGSSSTFPAGSISGWEVVSTTPTATQGTDLVYTDLTGSSKSYTPTSGSSYVVYEYNTHITGVDTYPHLLIKFIFDGSEQSNSNENYYFHTAGANFSTNLKFRYILSSWTGAKTMSLKYRSYSSTSDLQIHKTKYSGLGTATDVFVKINQITYSVM